LRSYDIPAGDIVKLYTVLGCDMVYLANLWELGRKNLMNAHGRRCYVDGEIKTRAALEQVILPDISQVKERIKSVYEHCYEACLGLIYAVNFVPKTVSMAIGPLDYSMSLMDSPDFIKDFQKIASEYCVAELQTALEIGG